MVARVLVIVAVLAGVARADWLRDVAATADGGAWAVTTDELWRIAPDGRRQVIASPVRGNLQAVASDGETLWLLAPDALAIRGDDGAWRTLALPPADDFSNVYATSAAVMTPLAPGRVLVLRACRNAQCTEVFVVDRDRIAVTATFDWVLGPAVADGRGGAWLVARRGYNSDVKIAYAHFDGAAWRSWSFHGAAIAGMTDEGKTRAFPEVAVAGDDGGFVAADDRRLWLVDRDGAVREKPLASEDPFRNRTLCAAGDRRELVIAQGDPSIEWDDPHATAPILIRIDRASGAVRADEADAPGWWRRQHESSTPWLRCAAAGGVAWILAEDALFRRDARGWHTYGAAGAAASAPGATRLLVSAPLGLGASDGPHFAADLRPELVVAPNRTRPRFAVGGFAELARAGGATFVGVGATAVSYHGNLGTALSAGVDERFAGGAAHPQLVLSGFVGARGPRIVDLPPAETPFGVRFEVRPATSDAPATFSVLATFDGPALVIAGAMLGAIASRHD